MTKTLKDLVLRDDIVKPVLNNIHDVKTLIKLNMTFWDAMNDAALRNGFKNQIEAKPGFIYSMVMQYENMIRYIGLKNKTVFRTKLRACQDIEAFEKGLLAMFDKFNTYYSNIYEDVPYMMFEFIDYILDREYELEQTPEAPVTEEKTVRNRRLSIVFPDGRQVVKRASDAMAAFVDYVGVEKVAAANAKLYNEPFVTKVPSFGTDRYYRSLSGGWYLNTSGDSITKYRLISFLNESLNAGVRVSLQLR